MKVSAAIVHNAFQTFATRLASVRAQFETDGEYVVWIVVIVLTAEIFTNRHDCLWLQKFELSLRFSSHNQCAIVLLADDLDELNRLVVRQSLEWLI